MNAAVKDPSSKKQKKLKYTKACVFVRSKSEALTCNRKAFNKGRVLPPRIRMVNRTITRVVVTSTR